MDADTQVGLWIKITWGTFEKTPSIWPNSDFLQQNLGGGSAGRNEGSDSLPSPSLVILM